MSLQPEADLLCPVCHDIFTDPVFLPCTHSFCKACLLQWWQENQVQKCPLCKELCPQRDPPLNRVLRNLCEAFREKKEKTALCSQHSKELSLFCLDHQEPVCFICTHSKTHNQHKFGPIDEAAEDHRQKMQESLQPFRNKLKIFERVKEKCDQTAEHIEVQARNTVSQIKEAFRRLHQFLEEEEEARISALREEVKEKSQTMKEKIEGLSREIEALSDTIRATEEELKADDVWFLLRYKAAVSRVQQQPLPEDPKLLPGALIDEAKHLGNLSFNIWDKMKVSYTPVVLDPNSAHPDLVLSEDLTSVTFKKGQKLPDNPERFDFYPIVLGSKGFNSGHHSWDVEVGDSKEWKVGVSAESVQRKGETPSRLWRLGFLNGLYTARSLPDFSITLFMEKKLKKVRVHLDWDKGKVWFSDADTDDEIYTFTHAFTDRLFPYVSNLSSTFPLKISPVQHQ